MDLLHYKEMKENLERLLRARRLQGQSVYLFGHCDASEELVDLLARNGYPVKAILDNNPFKHRMSYKSVRIEPPDVILQEDMPRTTICIAARACASMERQLRQMGYSGSVEKLVDYNSYAEYSCSEETIQRKQERVGRGIRLLKEQRVRYPGCYRIYCPFSALGDVYYTMAYLPHFLKRKSITHYAVFTIGDSCREVAKMFGTEHVQALSQNEMDESVQAALYTKDEEAYISHHDRPYAIYLVKALYIKKIPLERIYKYGVFGLDRDCGPCRPARLRSCSDSVKARIQQGRAVILSPYAKSVTKIPPGYWERIIAHFKSRGYQIFTNTAPGETALPGSVKLEIPLSELQSAAERAGIFIGLRSGLCDVIREADCKKIALYPDCFYSDTRWKVEEIFHLEGWENITIRDI